MKTAVYSKEGVKLAGDTELASRLPERIVKGTFPLREGDSLYTLLSDGSVLWMEGEGKAPDVYVERNTENKRMTKNDMIRHLLFGDAGQDVKALCSRFGLRYEENRRVFVAQADVDLEAVIPALNEMTDEEAVICVLLDGHRMAVVCADEDNTDMADALCATFSELNTDYYMGISALCTDVGGLAEAFRQATSAIEIGKKISYGGGVWSFSHLLPEMTLDALPADALPGILQKAEQIRRVLNEEDIFLAEEFFKHDLNISETARYCYQHRNTLIYRLDRIQKETGFNLRRFDEAVAFRLYIAAGKLNK